MARSCTVRSMRRIGAVLLAMSARPAAVVGQEVVLRAVVEQVAGADFYLSVGREAGIAAGDTLTVGAETDGALLGTLRVIAVASQRSVVTFLGEPFPVTRGTTLRITSGRSVPVGAAPEPAARRAPPASSRGLRWTPRVRGRVGLDMSGLQSSTTWRDNAKETVRRRFATPSVSLRLVGSRLPGGFGVEVAARGTYRYSDADLVQPVTAIRIRQLAVTNDFGNAPLEFRAGRFYGPYETYSGYWDGLVLRIGGQTIGLGGAIGFQPERADQAPSTTLPKYSVFADYALRKDPVRYETNVSFHRVLPSGDYLDHTFAGWSQRVRVGALRVATDLQVDDDPLGQTWALSRARARGTLSLTRSLSLHVRASHDRPYFLFRTASLLPFRRDQAGGGMMYFGSVASVGANVMMNRTGSGAWFAAYSGSVGLPSTGVFGLGLSAAATYSDLRGGTAWFVSTDLSRHVRHAELRGSYQFYRSAISGSILASHSAGVALTLPLGGHVFAALRGRTQFGAHIAATSVYASVWTTF